MFGLKGTKMNAHEVLAELQKSWDKIWEDEKKAQVIGHSIVSSDEQSAFFQILASRLNCSAASAMMLWYADQRSWYEPEMADVIVDIGNYPNRYDYMPNFTSGDFIWDRENKRFIPSE
jgi:hypothetical protein